LRPSRASRCPLITRDVMLRDATAATTRMLGRLKVEIARAEEEVR
jgi:hypothetical protein